MHRRSKSPYNVLARKEVFHGPHGIAYILTRISHLSQRVSKSYP